MSSFAGNLLGAGPVPAADGVIKSGASELLAVPGQGHGVGIADAAIDLADLPFLRDVPEADGFVMGAGDQRLAVLFQQKGNNRALVPLKRAQRLASLDVPETDLVIIAAGGQGLVIEKREGVGRALAIEVTQGLAVVGIPNSDGAVNAGRGEETAVGREGQRVDLLRVAFELDDLFARGEFPEVQRPVLAAG